MSSESNGGDRHWVTAGPPRAVHAPERAAAGWPLDLPLDHPSYPDPSNAWPPPASPPAVRTAAATVPTPAARPAAVSAMARAAEPDVAERFESLRALTGTVAHDINNLLAVIRNYTDFVADAVDDARGAQQGFPGAGPAGTGVVEPPWSGADGWDAVRRDVAQIQRAGERAAELAAELLAAVRRRPVLARLIDVNTVVRETVAMLRRPLGERVDSRLELDGALWAVRADPARLEQAIVNLAMNARDAMPRGGTLTVATGNVVLGPPPEAAVATFTPGPTGFGVGAPSWYPAARRHPAGHRPTGPIAGFAPAVSGPTADDARAGGSPTSGPRPGAERRGRRFVGIWISDTGDGMTSATRARAFEPYFTTKQADRGTGLGLAVVREVVTEAGGQVQLCSTVGVGTTVSLLLPAVDVPVAPASPEAPGRADADARWTYHHRVDGGAVTRPAAIRRPYGQPPPAISRTS